MTIEDIVVIIVITAAEIPLLRFIYRYHRFSPWNKDPIGRVLMQQKVALASLLGLVLLARLAPPFREWDGRVWISYAIFLWMVVLFWLMDLELEKTQKGTEFDRFSAFIQRAKVYRNSRRECRAERREVRRLSREKTELEDSSKDLV